jgi:PAS domain S-box-containing protein
LARVELNALGEEYIPIGEDINSMIKATEKNISELKEKEKEIEDARAFSDQIINTTVDCVCVVDNDGKWIRANPAWERLVGYKPEELLGKKTEEQPFMTPDAIKITKEKLWKDGYEKGTSFNVEMPFLHKNGEEITVLTSEGFLKDADGNDIGRLFVASDITELKENRQ